MTQKSNAFLVGLVAICVLTLVARVALPAPSCACNLQEDPVEKLTNSIGAFGLELFNLLAADGEDVFISPLSIHMALAMTYNGAQGETSWQMARALNVLSMNNKELNEGAKELLQELGRDRPDIELSIANSIWARKGLSFQEAFLKTGERFYGARIEKLDFNSSAALEKINGWVSQKTKGKINKIIEQIDPQAITFLINAVYFKGAWQDQFEKSNTKEKTFFLPEGSEKKHPLMSQSGRFRYLENEKIQMIRLPYGKEGNLGAYVLLPRESHGLKDLIAELSWEKWTAWLAEMKREEGRLELPRFGLRYEKVLNEPLKKLGLKRAFEEKRADLSGIIALSGENAYINQVKHKTFLEVDEKGTEAAAATSVEVRATAMPSGDRFEMVVNRPFLFAVADRKTKALLFLGAIREPKEID